MSQIVKTLVAMNAFKDAPDDVVAINQAAAEVLKQLGHTTKICPVADGGTGTLEAFRYHAETKGGQEQEAIVKDPLGKNITAKWLHLPVTNTAIIAMEKASGLPLVEVEKRNPLVTSSYGTGQLIQAAIDKGCKTILLTIGGSATVDGGIGMLRALGAEFKDANGGELMGSGADLEHVASINLDKVRKTLGDVKIVALSDVKTPWKAANPMEGVLFYAPQKFRERGDFSGNAKLALERGVENFAKVVDALAGRKASIETSTGAAGGLVYIPVAALGTKVSGGFDHLEKMFSLEAQVKESDVIITGEGRLDKTTFEGKAPAAIIELARNNKKPVVFICGSVDDTIDWKERGINMVIKIKPDNMALPEAIKKTTSLIENSLKEKAQVIAALHKAS